MEADVACLKLQHLDKSYRGGCHSPQSYLMNLPCKINANNFILQYCHQHQSLLHISIHFQFYLMPLWYVQWGLYSLRFFPSRHFEVLLRRFVFPASEVVDHTAISSSPKDKAIDDEAIHILMVAIKSDKTGNSDEELSEKFHNFCQQKVDKWNLLKWLWHFVSTCFCDAFLPIKSAAEGFKRMSSTHKHQTRFESSPQQIRREYSIMNALLSS